MFRIIDKKIQIKAKNEIIFLIDTNVGCYFFFNTLSQIKEQSIS